MIKMFFESILFCLIYSFSSQTVDANGASRNNRPWKSQTSCGSYFVKEMFHLFSDEKIDGKIQQAILELQKAQKENKIAFTAGIPKFKTYSSGEIIKFTKVITNVGGGLNASDGVFCSPEPGLYSFFVNIMSKSDRAYAEIHKNDKFVMFVLTDFSGSNWKTGTNAVILQLEKGDRVSVKSTGSYNFHSDSSHFSGHKI